MPLNIINSLTIGKYAKKAAAAVNWVAVGQGSLIANSTDGKDWTAAATVGGLTTQGRSVAYGTDGSGNPRWVAVGDGSIFAYSADGKDWNAAATKGGITFGFSVAYGKDGAGNPRWVAVGDGSYIAYSPNGNDWYSAATKGGITRGWCVAYGTDGAGNPRWVAVGSPFGIAYSSDGNVWYSAVTTNITDYTISSVAYGTDGAGNPRWVAVTTSVYQTIIYSPDGNNWTVVPEASRGGLTKGNGVAYGKDGAGNPRWVIAGGKNTGDQSIAYSSNGSNWTAAPANSLSQGRAVAYGNGRWVATGDQNPKTIIYSSNGNSWSNDTTLGGITSIGFGVAFKNEIV